MAGRWGCPLLPSTLKAACASTGQAGASALPAGPDAAALAPTTPPGPGPQVLLLETLYGTLVANCRPTTRVYHIPRESLLSIGIDFQL